jgi:4-hydroxybenzoate polyprenyltransferase
MKIKTWLTLGRVSNLPTVWTNVFAAALLAQASLIGAAGDDMIFQHSNVFWMTTLAALSLMYLGGMFLNDAFDAEWDRKNSNPRPIAKGDIAACWVWITGSLMLVIAIVLIAYLYQATQHGSVIVFGFNIQALYGLFAAILLALTIILYNAIHKQFVHSAFVMGACRCGVYLIAALLLVEVSFALALAAISLWLYIAGITYLARDEHTNRLVRYWPLALLFSPVFIGASLGSQSIYFWLFVVGFCGWLISRIQSLLNAEQPNVKACIGGLLAAIPLFDGLMLASVDAVIPSLVCVSIFLSIPRLHLWISGT